MLGGIEISFELIFAIIGGVAIPIVLGWSSRLQSRITAAKEDLSEFKIKAAETYITKAEHLTSDLKGAHWRLKINQ